MFKAIDRSSILNAFKGRLLQQEKVARNEISVIMSIGGSSADHSLTVFK